MIGDLDKSHIDRMLNSNVVGRIGCCHDNQAYIVPIIYAYNPPYLYAHSREGMKLDIMRENPKVTFQIDDISDYRNWQSIILTGEFEELTGDGAREGMELLKKQLLPYNLSSHTLPEFDTRMTSLATLSGHSIVYRILIKEYSGRFEKSD